MAIAKRIAFEGSTYSLGSLERVAAQTAVKETGAVYSPYVPLITTPLVYDPSDFTPHKGVMTRYAKKMIRPEFYGNIKVKSLDLI